MNSKIPDRKRSDITFSSKFENHRINTGKYKNLGAYKTMLRTVLKQLNSLLTHHSRVSLLLFELHHPVTANVTAASGNQNVTEFFKKLKNDLSKSIWGKQKDVIHFWAREVGESKKGHYHCMIGFSSTVRVGTFYATPCTHAWKLLKDRWEELSGGFLTGNSCHVVNRFNQKEFDSAFEHLSYACKTRDKDFGTGDKHKRFSGSRLKPKIVKGQLSKADHHSNSLENFFSV